MAKKIKLAQVIAGTDVAGAKGYTIQLATECDKTRFDVCHIHVHEGMTTVEARQAGIEPHIIGQNPYKLAKLMKELNLDLIHTHGVRANFLGRYASRLTGIPNICTMHSDSRLDYGSKLKERAVWFADNVGNSWCNAFIGVSRDMSEKLMARGIPSEKVFTVYNGIDLRDVQSTADKAQTKQRFGIEPKLRLIGTVGRLVEVKGHDDLVAALPFILQKVPDAAVLIVGDGRCQEPLREQSIKLRIQDRVFLPGRIKRPWDLMHACDVGCFPSINEAIGLALLEYMALDVPIVATNVGGIPEVITKSEYGILVPPKNPRELANAIIDVMTKPELAAGLAKAGRARVEERFTTQKMLEETQKVWELMARKSV
jgi:glycosyltransferase involved in cell wall biosynthesis